MSIAQSLRQKRLKLGKSLSALFQIAEILEIDVRELINHTKQKKK